MGETLHNKLVRDLIPDILSKKGVLCRTRVLTDPEFRPALLAKLQEETSEYLHAQTPQERNEELADILEVVLALLALDGSVPSDLERIRQEKLRHRGGFTQKIFLEKTISPDSSEKS